MTWTAWLSTVAIVLGSSVARSQTQAEDVAAARALGLQGARLADQGHCPEAIEKLERAEALYHAPTILGRLGECQVEVGRIVLGTENLNRVVREQLPANAPQPFRLAQERARKVLERAVARIAYLVVRVEPKEVTPTVTVSGVPVPTALLGVERPTDPGTHEVAASAPGYEEVKTTVALSEGARQEVLLTLARSPSAATTLPETKPISPPPIASSTLPPRATLEVGSKPPARTLPYALLGVAGAGLVTSAITGAVALSKKNSLDCPDQHCPKDQQSALDSARTLATVSTISFGVGVASAAVSVVLLLTSHGDESAASALANGATFSAKPWFDARSLGIEGKF